MKVVYILGAGRSGSTALGIALGSLPAVFYAGELVAWNQFKGKPLSGSDETFDFWKRVKNGVEGADEFFRHDFFRSLEHYRALFRPHKAWNDALIRKYAALNGEMFRTIAECSGCDVIVDSSHYPLRLRRLRAVKEIDLRVVYLVRDPRAVINSLQKPVQRKSPMTPLGANLYCIVANLISTLVFWTVPRDRRVRIRYEDFAADPDGTVVALAGFVGVEAPESDYSRLPTGLSFHANRIREQRSIAITPHPYPNNMSWPWRALTNIIQFPFVLAHRTRVDRRRASGPPGRPRTRAPAIGPTVRWEPERMATHSTQSRDAK